MSPTKWVYCEVILRGLQAIGNGVYMNMKKRCLGLTGTYVGFSYRGFRYLERYTYCKHVTNELYLARNKRLCN